MGVKISKCYSSYKAQPNVLKGVLNFPSNVPYKTILGIFDILNFPFLALPDFVSRATVVAQASVFRHSSVNTVFSETASWIPAKFYDKLPISHIDLQTAFFVFQNFQCLHFYHFFSLLLTREPKVLKSYFLHSFTLISTKHYVNYGGI